MKRFLLIFIGSLWLSAPAFALEIQSVKSPSGIEAWLIEDRTLPIISMSFSFSGGNRLDADGKTGTAEMAASLLDEGAGDMDGNAFQDRLAALATSLSFQSEADYFSGNIRTLTENRDTAFDLLRLALAEPSLEKSAIERMRAAILASIRDNANNPNVQAEELWRTAFFKNHPYGKIRNAETIKVVNKADIQKFLSQSLNRRTLKIGVSGDIDAEQLSALLDKTFGFLKDFDAAIPPAAFAPPKAGGEAVKFQSQPQTVAMFGHIGLKRDHPDFYPFFVLNHIIGGGSFESRLTTEVRKKNGLAYSVGSYVETLQETGVIAGNVATKKQDFYKSRDLIRQIWEKAANDITDAEVDKAKRYLLGSFPLRFSSTGQIAAILLNIQQDNLGIDFFTRRNSLVEAVGADDVRQAAKNYLHAGRLLFSIVGDYQTEDSGKP